MGAYEYCPPDEILFNRGDTNADGERNVTDVVFVLTHLFGGGEEPSCMKSADANDSGKVDLADAVYFLNFLFGGGPEPPEPLGECGFDPTIDDLTCDSFEGVNSVQLKLLFPFVDENLELPAPRICRPDPAPDNLA